MVAMEIYEHRTPAIRHSACNSIVTELNFIERVDSASQAALAGQVMVSLTNTATSLPDSSMSLN